MNPYSADKAKRKRKFNKSSLKGAKNDDFIIFEVGDSGERKRLNIAEEQFRENDGRDVLYSDKVLIIVKIDLQRIYIWKGADSTVRKRFISSRLAQTLLEELQGDILCDHCKIISVDAGDEPSEFLKAFGFESTEVSKRTKRIAISDMHEADRNIIGFNDILRQLLAVNLNIQGAVIVSKQGLLICYVLTRGVNDSIVKAVSTAILDVSEGTLKELARGDLKRVLIEAPDKIYILSKSGEKEISYSSAKSDTSLGIVDLDIQNDIIADKFEHAVEELTRGNLKRILIKGVDGITILSKAGENAILCTLTKDESSLGMVFLNILSVSKRIAELLEEQSLIMFCENCGMELQDPNQKFCPNCGIPLRNIQSTILFTGLDKILGVNAALVATNDGLPIASTLPYGLDESRVATMTAALYSLAKGSVNEIGKGKFDQLQIKGTEGFLTTLQAGPNALLTVFTTKDVRGLMLLDFKKISEKIAKLI